MRFLGELRPALLAGAPNIFAVLTAVAGVLLLASGATPSDPDRFMWLADHAPLILIEISHFVSSLLGIVLFLLAFGLSRRLDGAWATSLVVLVAAAGLALFKGFNWEESVILLILACAMAPCRAAFPRSARLTRMEITPGWMLSALAIVGGVALAGWWSFQHLDYANVSVLKLMADADAERAIILCRRCGNSVGCRCLAHAGHPGHPAHRRRERSGLCSGARHTGVGGGLRALLEPGAAGRQALSVFAVGRNLFDVRRARPVVDHGRRPGGPAG